MPPDDAGDARGLAIDGRLEHAQLLAMAALQGQDQLLVRNKCVGRLNTMLTYVVQYVRLSKCTSVHEHGYYFATLYMHMYMTMHTFTWMSI